MLSKTEEKKGRALLSFDGGGIGVLSSLLILRELMYRIQHKLKLNELPLPCECFDMIAGCGFGGLAAVMLGRLHMTVNEAIASFYSIMVDTFSEKRWSIKESRTKNLERAIANLVRKHAKEGNFRMMDENDRFTCKTFVCVALGHNLCGVERLRTYLGTKNQAPNYTIEEALLATTAIRGIFEPRTIQESTGLNWTYVAADLVCGNPTAIMLEEAQDIFPDQYVACVVSLGSGHPQVASILDSDSKPIKHSVELVTVLERIATDCETKAQDMFWRFQKVYDFYFRFNVDQGMQLIRESDYQQASAIQAHTTTFISKLDKTDAAKITQAAQTVVERRENMLTPHLVGVAYASPNLESRIQLCPPPSPNFTGRGDVLQILLRYFTTPSSTQRSFVLYGLGGSGKTQIARTFVEQYRNQFSEVYHIDATSSQTIELDFKNVARAKNVGQTVSDVFYWFKAHESNWIIYYDNADDIQLDLRRYFPDCLHGNLLITTRNKNLVAYSRDLGLSTQCDYAVSRMTPNDAEDLLLRFSRRGTESERTQAARIVEMLGFHALAITQAGAYINVQEYRLDEYLDECLRTDGLLEKSMLSDILIDHDYPRRLYATWMLSYEKLTPDTLTLLHCLAFMHHTGITEDIFRIANSRIHYQEYVPDNLLASFLSRFKDPIMSCDTVVTWSSSAFKGATLEARSYCLLEYNRQASVYSIHPLVHQWIRRLAHPHLANSTAMLLALCVYEQYEPDDFAFRRTLLPHIDALPEVQRTDPKVAAQFSLVYREAGRWSEAEKLEEIALNYRRDSLGEYHSDTLASVHNLGVVYREQGRLELAEQSLTMAMEARKGLLGEDGAKALDSAHQLARVYLEQKKWELARTLEDEVLNARRRTKGENHPDTLDSMSFLAWAYWGLGRLTEAQILEEEVVDATKRILKMDHPHTLQSIHNLSATYRSHGLLDKAELLADEVVGLRSKLLGRQHPHTLVTMCNLGGIYLLQGRLSEAEELLKEVVESRSKVLGEHHPHTLLAMNDLAATYVTQRRWEEADILMNGVMEHQKAHGLDIDLITTLNTLAIIQGYQGNWPKARELMKQVVEGRRRMLGENHLDTLASIKQLAEWEPAVNVSRRRLSSKHFVIGFSILVLVLSWLFYFL